MGSDVGFDATMRMRQELQELAVDLRNNSEAVDSPVYATLRDLQPPKRRFVPGNETHVASTQPKPDDRETYSAKFEFAREAKYAGDFDLAKRILQQIYEEQTRPGRDGRPKAPQPDVTQELALATYKAGEKAALNAGPDVALAGYFQAAALLQQLDPETTRDPRTLGLWSAIHKRRAEMPTQSEAQRRAEFDIAIDAAERGFRIGGDSHAGSNLAYLLDLRASMSPGDDQFTDRGHAEQVRRRVVDLSAKRLETLEAEGTVPAGEPGAWGVLQEEKYWTMASLAESLIALGDKSGPDFLQKAIASAPSKWMAEVTLNQLDKLQTLLGGMPQKK
jgi:hypothetical protein